MEDIFYLCVDLNVLPKNNFDWVRRTRFMVFGHNFSRQIFDFFEAGVKSRPAIDPAMLVLIREAI
jgi:hypothetical protein